MLKSRGKSRGVCSKWVSYAIVSALSMIFVLVVQRSLSILEQNRETTIYYSINDTPNPKDAIYLLNTAILTKTLVEHREAPSEISFATTYPKNWTCFRRSKKKYIYLDWEYDGSEFSNINYRSVESLLGLYKDNDVAFRMLMIGPPMMEFYKIGNTLRYGIHLHDNQQYFFWK